MFSVPFQQEYIYVTATTTTGTLVRSFGSVVLVDLFSSQPFSRRNLKVLGRKYSGPADIGDYYIYVVMIGVHSMMRVTTSGALSSNPLGSENRATSFRRRY